VWCLFDPGWKISFEQVQIRSMTMTLASTLQIRRHEYSGDLNRVNLVIFVSTCTLSFYAINMDDVSLFTYSSFLFLANLDLYCIDILYQFKWMNIIYFCKKKKKNSIVLLNERREEKKVKCKKNENYVPTKDIPRVSAYKIEIRISDGWWNTIQLSKILILISTKTSAQTFSSQTIWCRDMIRSFCINYWIISNSLAQWSNWYVLLKYLHKFFFTNNEQCDGEIWFNLFAWTLE